MRFEDCMKALASQRVEGHQYRMVKVATHQVEIVDGDRRQPIKHTVFNYELFRLTDDGHSYQWQDGLWINVSDDLHGDPDLFPETS